LQKNYQSRFTTLTDIEILKKSIQGAWNFCNSGSDVTIVFDQGSYVQTLTAYDDTECSGDIKDYTREFTGTYEITEFDPNIPGGFYINWYQDDHTMQTHTANYTDYANGAGIYNGYFDPLCQDFTFIQDTEVSLIGKTCNLNSTGYELVTADTLYDMMFLSSDGQLYDSRIMVEGEGDSTDNRVSGINWTLIYTK
jgi:hypothetical protein